MKIDVRFVGLEPSAALRDHAVRRLHLHLSRFGREVSMVVVRLRDVNGPKGGLDKHCQVSLRGPRVSAVIGDVHEDAYAAVDLVVGRLTHAVGRVLERRRADHAPLLAPSRAS